MFAYDLSTCNLHYNTLCTTDGYMDHFSTNQYEATITHHIHLTTIYTIKMLNTFHVIMLQMYNAHCVFDGKKAKRF